MLTTLLIAVALAMDAVAVSISSGLNIKGLRIAQALRVAGAFGLAQAVMPVIGWFAGNSAGPLIANFDHWVAFALLVAAGGRMIREGLKTEASDSAFDPLHPSNLLLLAVATSIDALAVGIGLSLLHIPILRAALLIGAMTFLLSFVGAIAGNRLECHCERKAELLGGLVLIAIGVKILVEHTL